jgi:hypothetical protein
MGFAQSFIHGEKPLFTLRLHDVSHLGTQPFKLETPV